MRYPFLFLAELALHGVGDVGVEDPTGQVRAFCLLGVSEGSVIAYKRIGVKYPLADAINQWHRMPDRRHASSGYWPRYGDPVFWDIARPYGHTALYIGGTKVVGTQGMDGDGLPVAIDNLHSRPNYLGYGRVA